MSAFGDAFKAARAAGKKTFTFNGESYHTRTKEDEAKAKDKKPDVSKAKAGPAEYEAKKTPPMDEATKARVRRNRLEQAAMKGKPEIIKPVDKSPKKFGEDGKIRREKPVDIPERRRLGPKTEAPEMIKTSDKKDDTDLSVSERIKNARERARTSDTGTDKRSVTDRLKSAMGMKKGGSVRGYGMARGGKACKMR